MVTPDAPSTAHTSSVPAIAAGPNSTRIPTTPKAIATSWRGEKPSCPMTTAKPSSAIGVRAELITAASPAVMYFSP